MSLSLSISKLEPSMASGILPLPQFKAQSTASSLSASGVSVTSGSAVVATLAEATPLATVDSMTALIGNWITFKTTVGTSASVTVIKGGEETLGADSSITTSMGLSVKA